MTYWQSLAIETIATFFPNRVISWCEVEGANISQKKVFDLTHARSYGVHERGRHIRIEHVVAINCQ